MAFGDGSCDSSLRDAWIEFCARLQEAGERVFKDYNPAAPLQRADAFRFLTQNLGQAFDLGLETKDTRYPLIHQFVTPRCKLGADAADFSYQQAWIDGESVYRVSGNRGTVRFLNFTVMGARPDKLPGTEFRSLHAPFGDVTETNLFGQQLKTSWDGGFELYIGGPQRGPNWLPTTSASRKLYIRQGFDRWDEQPARMSIERIDMTEPQPLPTPEAIVNGIKWAGNFMSGLMNDWPDLMYVHGVAVDVKNFNVFPQQELSVDDKRRGRSIANMGWHLASDDALIIEFNSHNGFWMMSNMGVFCNSMDYLYRPVSYTTSRAKVNKDGKVRLILSHKDPGYHNWLDTQGFEKGNVTFRNIQNTEATVLNTRLVKYADLRGVLPSDMVTVTPEERIELMKTRFNSVLQRFHL